MNAASISPAPVKSPPPPAAPVPPNPTPPPAYGLAQAEALYDYHSNDEGDLTIIAGQRVTILEYVNNGTLLLIIGVDSYRLVEGRSEWPSGHLSIELCQEN